jgi:DNA-binding MarR family transcriptional regulator
MLDVPEKQNSEGKLPETLTEAETEIWRAIKSISGQPLARIAQCVKAATGLSQPDFDLLDYLDERGNATLRLRELAEEIGWSLSRVSHHVIRMEKRGLLRRRNDASCAATRITMTEKGKLAISASRPIHAKAFRLHILARLTQSEQSRLHQMIAKLLNDDGSS